MLRYLTLGLIALLVVFSIGCGGGSTTGSPLVPAIDREASAAVTPGSNMTANQLRDYFCYMLVTTNFPQSYWCPVWQIFRPKWNQLTDLQMLSYVALIEMQGVDVPNAPPPPPIC